MVQHSYKTGFLRYGRGTPLRQTSAAQEAQNLHTNSQHSRPYSFRNRIAYTDRQTDGHG